MSGPYAQGWQQLMDLRDRLRAAVGTQIVSRPVLAGAGAPWTEEEIRLAHEAIRAGKNDREIGEMLGRPQSSVRNKTYLLRAPAVKPEIATVARWTCQNCNTRSDADLDFGCNACWPLRREEARLVASGQASRSVAA